MKKQIALAMLSTAALAGDSVKYQTDGFAPVVLPNYPRADLNTLYQSSSNTKVTDQN